MKATDMVFELKAQFKNAICNILVDRYKELHNGELPNWENDEEIVLTEDEIDDTKVNYLHIDLYNTYDEYCEVVEMPINTYIVTLDYNLYFTMGDANDEYEWYEIGIDDLAKLLDYLNEKFN